MKTDKEIYSKIRQKKSKKALSVIIGYVLLVTFTIVMGIFVYELLKTYVPQNEINCPDGSSLLIESYTCDSNILTLNIANNGNFEIGGYFIYASDSPDKDLATIDLSKLNTNPNSELTPLGIQFGNSGDKTNSLDPGQSETNFYNLTEIGGKIYLVDIIPIRWQTQDTKSLLVSCKNAEERKTIKCS